MGYVFQRISNRSIKSRQSLFFGSSFRKKTQSSACSCTPGCGNRGVCIHANCGPYRPLLHQREGYHAHRLLRCKGAGSVSQGHAEWRQNLYACFLNPRRKARPRDTREVSEHDVGASPGACYRGPRSSVRGERPARRHNSFRRSSHSWLPCQACQAKLAKRENDRASLQAFGSSRHWRSPARRFAQARH